MIPMKCEPLATALALVDGDEVTWLPSDAVARPGLPLLSQSAEGWAGLWWFCLTDAAGARQYAYVHSFSQRQALCILSPERHQPTCFFALLECIIRLTRRDLYDHLHCLSCLLFAPLPRPPCTVAIELCAVGNTPPVRPTVIHRPLSLEDGVLWDGLLGLGLATALELWHALLLERPVLLISSVPPLLVAASEALLTLLQPFEWAGTFPIIPNPSP